jgi:hypothetical protein
MADAELVYVTPQNYIEVIGSNLMRGIACHDLFFPWFTSDKCRISISILLAPEVYVTKESFRWNVNGRHTNCEHAQLMMLSGKPWN